MEIKKVKHAEMESTICDVTTYYSVTEWPNGEGYDFSIECGTGEKHISLHLDDIDALNYLILGLKNDDSL